MGALFREYADLFLTFVKLGCITFGGGYAMMPVLERELIRKKGWISMEEVLDYFTIAQVTPGVIAVNVSTFIGHKRRGISGGILATVGFVLPGVSLMTVLALVVARFAEYPAVRHGFAGIRIAVGALVVDTVLKLLKGVFKDRKGVAIFVLAFSLSAFFSLSPVLLVGAAGIAGFLIYRPGRRTGTAGPGGGQSGGDGPA
jgi:chromate transporter